MGTVGCRMGIAMVVIALQAQAAEPWQHVTKENQPLLPGDEIQFVKLGADKGQVWIGTLNGAAEIRNGVLFPLKPANGLKVWDITKRPEGGLWIGHSKGALLVDGDRAAATLEGRTVASIQMVGGRLWAIAKDESKDVNVLMQADGESWTPVAAFKDRRVLDLVRDAKGTFWAVLDGDGVMEVDPKQGPHESRHHLSRLNVTSIMTDSRGHTWCGMMGGGVMVREDKEWQRQLDGESTAVLGLIEDGDGKIWAATSGNGVWVFDGKDWKGMLQDQGAVNLLKATADKRVWVGTQRSGGLKYWDGKEWQESLESPLPLRCLLELPSGVLLAGGVLDGLYVLGDYSIKGE